MAWIKRNLFFAIGGAIALLLLGAAAFYNFKGWNHNSVAFQKLNEIYGNLQTLNSQKPAPGDGKKINNTQTAKDQEREIRAWTDQTGNYFKPIAAIPNLPEVTSEAFAAALRRTIDQLQREAETASVQLPPKYGFSFEAQRSIVRFAPGSLAPLAVQLGEVKTISEILFAARVNSFDSIQRLRVSDDDAAGSQSDYIADPAVTNDLAVLTPYAVTFRSFTPELAAVLTGFAAAPNGFIVKGLNVSPAGATASIGVPDASGAFGRYGGGYPGGGYTPPVAPAPGAGKGGLQTFLNEQLLRVTIEVVIVKPFPKK
ncbi:MAG: Amuc_1100 family pilus-like protein [Verrucomicrobiales bacterium]|nr:Amuc_1100 family pilus-like protein [Verrucomicrobiales bacterium]